MERALIKAGAPVSETLLVTVAGRGSEEMLDDLLDTGAEPGHAVMMAGVVRAHDGILRCLLDHGGVPDSGMLAKAVKQEWDSYTHCKMLLDHGALVSNNVLIALANNWWVKWNIIDVHHAKAADIITATIDDTKNQLSCLIIEHAHNLDEANICLAGPADATDAKPRKQLPRLPISILGAAVSSGNLEVTQAALAAGCDPFRVMGPRLPCPMHMAVGKSDDMVELLVRHEPLSRWTRRRRLMTWRAALGASC